MWYKALYIMLPVIFSAPLTVYLFDGVLKYRFTNRKATYLASWVFSFFAAVVTVFLCFNKNGEVMFQPSYDLLEVLKMVFVLVLMLLNMKCKLWKKLVLTVVGDMLMISFTEIFSTIRELIFLSLELTSPTNTAVVYLLLEVLSLLIEAVLFVCLDKIRRKHDDSPLPIHVILEILLVDLAFSILLAMQMESYAADGSGEFMDYARISLGQRSGLMLSMLLAISAFVILFYIRATRKERDDLKDINRINEELVSSQTRFYEASVKADSEIRAIRHDMKNHVQVLTLLLENQEYDQMRDYLKEMSSNLQSTDISAHTGDVIADAILSAKTGEAKERGISLVTNGVISGITITPQDMCKMLANLLDNAIEATADERLADLGEEFKKIVVEFKKTEKFFMLSVTNPCAEMVKVMDEDDDGAASARVESKREPVAKGEGQKGKLATESSPRAFKIIRSGKKDKKNHGFGLKNIQSAAENYDGEFSATCEEKPYGFEFRAEIVFPVEK
ncbi:MAG: GHKL domain-containing protein [Clostridiales bacterium]|nr:GHKL domain-containing protein [Clostridiales bacterium]